MSHKSSICLEDDCLRVFREFNNSFKTQNYKPFRNCMQEKNALLSFLFFFIISIIKDNASS